MDLRLLLILLSYSSSLALSGCAVVNVNEATNNEVSVTRHIGWISIEVQPKAGPVFVKAEGIGALKSIDGLTLGYHEATFVATSPGSCQITVWVANAEEVKAVEELRARYPDICVIGPKYPPGGQL
jgi:hypothetical protein